MSPNHEIYWGISLGEMLLTHWVSTNLILIKSPKFRGQVVSFGMYLII